MEERSIIISDIKINAKIGEKKYLFHFYATQPLHMNQHKQDIYKTNKDKQ